jgi:hypothetical protein
MKTIFKHPAKLIAILLMCIAATQNLSAQSDNLYQRIPKRITYDEAPPDIRRPTLSKPAQNYDPTEMETFPEYVNPHTVDKPLSTRPLNARDESLIALWCTKDSTYLVSVNEQHWTRHYFQWSKETYIKDVKTGKKYYLDHLQGLPIGMTYFIIGVPATYFCTVAVFPPLPKKCTVIDIVEGDITDKVKNAPGWSGGLKLYNVPVHTLQSHKYIANYKEWKIIY